MPDDPPNGKTTDGELEAHRELVDLLKDQVETKDQQIKELHVLLQQAQAALPSPKEIRSWWRRLWARG
jgi:hypothetical protein